MENKFAIPKTKEEFISQVENRDPKAVLSMLNSCRQRRADAVRSWDAEISFWEAAQKYFESGVVDWPRATSSKTAKKPVVELRDWNLVGTRVFGSVGKGHPEYDEGSYIKSGPVLNPTKTPEQGHRLETEDVIYALVGSEAK